VGCLELFRVSAVSRLPTRRTLAMTHPRLSPLKQFIREWIAPYAVMALIIIPIRSAIADTNWVPTGSMKPTILEGDLVYVNKLAYDLRVPLTFKRIARWSEPQPGEIVVFYSPVDDTRLIKRIIAVPGDTIEMRNAQLIVNGKPLDYTLLDTHDIHEEVYEDVNPIVAREHGMGTPHAVMAFPSRPGIRSFAPLTVPPGKYFMMGDSRDNSLDSRYFGFANREQIVGRAQRVLVSVAINRQYQPRFDRFGAAL
jgi:signal peptidase I